MKKNNLSLWFILILCGLPVVLSYWFFYFSDYAKEGPKSNYGSLIAPSHALAEINLFNQMQPNRVNTFKGKWSLIYVVPEECETACREELWLLYKLELLLGKDSLRVQRILLFDGNTDPEVARIVPGQWLPELSVAEQADLLQKLHLLVKLNINKATLVGRLYLSDPLGRVMMYYPPSFDVTRMMKDLKRLLKASKIG